MLEIDHTTPHQFLIKLLASVASASEQTQAEYKDLLTSLGTKGFKDKFEAYAAARIEMVEKAYSEVYTPEFVRLCQQELDNFSKITPQYSTTASKAEYLRKAGLPGGPPYGVLEHICNQNIKAPDQRLMLDRLRGEIRRTGGSSSDAIDFLDSVKAIIASKSAEELSGLFDTAESEMTLKALTALSILEKDFASGAPRHRFLAEIINDSRNEDYYIVSPDNDKELVAANMFSFVGGMKIGAGARTANINAILQKIQNGYLPSPSLYALITFSAGYEKEHLAYLSFYTYFSQVAPKLEPKDFEALGQTLQANPPKRDNATDLKPIRVYIEPSVEPEAVGEPKSFHQDFLSTSPFFQNEADDERAVENVLLLATETKQRALVLEEAKQFGLRRSEILNDDHKFKNIALKTVRETRAERRLLLKNKADTRLEADWREGKNLSDIAAIILANVLVAENQLRVSGDIFEAFDEYVTHPNVLGTNAAGVQSVMDDIRQEAMANVRRLEGTIPDGLLGSVFYDYVSTLTNRMKDIRPLNLDSVRHYAESLQWLETQSRDTNLEANVGYLDAENQWHAIPLHEGQEIQATDKAAYQNFLKEFTKEKATPSPALFMLMVKNHVLELINDNGNADERRSRSMALHRLFEGVIPRYREEIEGKFAFLQPQSAVAPAAQNPVPASTGLPAPVAAPLVLPEDFAAAFVHSLAQTKLTPETLAEAVVVYSGEAQMRAADLVSSHADDVVLSKIEKDLAAADKALMKERGPLAEAIGAWKKGQGISWSVKLHIAQEVAPEEYASEHVRLLAYGGSEAETQQVNALVQQHADAYFTEVERGLRKAFDRFKNLQQQRQPNNAQLAEKSELARALFPQYETEIQNGDYSWAKTNPRLPNIITYERAYLNALLATAQQSLQERGGLERPAFVRAASAFLAAKNADAFYMLDNDGNKIPVAAAGTAPDAVDAGMVEQALSAMHAGAVPSPALYGMIHHTLSYLRTQEGRGLDPAREAEDLDHLSHLYFTQIAPRFPLLAEVVSLEPITPPPPTEETVIAGGEVGPIPPQDTPTPSVESLPIEVVLLSTEGVNTGMGGSGAGGDTGSVKVSLSGEGGVSHDKVVIGGVDSASIPGEPGLPAKQWFPLMIGADDLQKLNHTLLERERMGELVVPKGADSRLLQAIETYGQAHAALFHALGVKAPESRRGTKIGGTRYFVSDPALESTFKKEVEAYKELEKSGDAEGISPPSIERMILPLTMPERFSAPIFYRHATSGPATALQKFGQAELDGSPVIPGKNVWQEEDQAADNERNMGRTPIFKAAEEEADIVFDAMQQRRRMHYKSAPEAWEKFQEDAPIDRKDFQAIYRQYFEAKRELATYIAVPPEGQKNGYLKEADEVRFALDGYLNHARDIAAKKKISLPPLTTQRLLTGMIKDEAVQQILNDFESKTLNLSPESAPSAAITDLRAAHDMLVEALTQYKEMIQPAWVYFADRVADLNEVELKQQQHWQDHILGADVRRSGTARINPKEGDASVFPPRNRVEQAVLTLSINLLVLQKLAGSVDGYAVLTPQTGQFQDAMRPQLVAQLQEKKILSAFAPTLLDKSMDANEISGLIGSNPQEKILVRKLVRAINEQRRFLCLQEVDSEKLEGLQHSLMPQLKAELQKHDLSLTLPSPFVTTERKKDTVHYTRDPSKYGAEFMKLQALASSVGPSAHL